MKKRFGIAVILGLLTAPCAYALLGLGNSLDSLWTDKAVSVDGQATEWSEEPFVEDAGLSFRAMNDAANLYLLIRGTNSDGRIVMAGQYRQNVTLWILKPDRKTKAWGINLDFGSAHLAKDKSDPTLSDMGIVPEMIEPQGLKVLTTTFPPDIQIQADLSSQRGRQPVYELCIPLERIHELKGRSLFLSFTTAPISLEVKAELQGSRLEEPKPKSGGASAGGGRHRRGMGGGGGESSASSVEVPKPLALHLTVTLAKAPKKST